MCGCRGVFTSAAGTCASGRSSRIKMIFRTVLALFFVFRVTAINDSAEFDRGGANVVWGKAGGEVILPCDVSVPVRGDAVSMVLWFKDSTAMPLYSLDFRGGPLVHWANTDDLGSRTHFILDEGRPHAAHLAIKDVSLADEGVFRCRVDFFDSPTRNYKVNLSLVVAPNEPRIFDGQGREIAGVAGPFREGYDLYLACQVAGGRPPPKVTWWHGTQMLESIADPTSPTGTVSSQIFIGTVTRQLYAARFQCRAEVSDLIPPTIKEIHLQVYLKPVMVHIVSPNDLLPSGKPRALRCETTGSYPAARLSWLLDGEVIRSHPVTVTTTGNNTSSIATLILSSADDGKDLTCRATNPWFPGGVLEETRTINVAFSPRVTITVGSSEDPSTLKEGGDVQLICNTDARPAVDKYAWFRGGEQLLNDPAEGLVVLGRTMRIRNLTREDSGNYSCKAANTEGNAKSQILTLKILYVPVCKTGIDAREIATLRHAPVQLRCEVDSPPAAGAVKFSWTYSRTRDVSPIPASRSTTTGTVSELTYTPQVTGDFGTLACWATNSAGHQKNACLFNITPAKVPDPPQECNLVNGSRSLEVSCRPGADGGIPQHFVLEVLAAVKPSSTLEPPSDIDNEISTMNDQGAWPETQSVPLYRETGGEPRFALHGLRPGRLYGLLVYAENARGRSTPVKLRDVTVSEELAAADKYHNHNDIRSFVEDANSPTSQPMAMVLGALVAAALLILLAIISAAAVVICKRRGSRIFGCGNDASKRESSSGPSMYAAPDDENGFGLHFGAPTVMIRPCADIRRDGRRASRALSSLQEESSLATHDISIIGQETDEFNLNPVGVRLGPQDMYPPVNFGVANIPDNFIYPEYRDMEGNIYSQMVPLNRVSRPEVSEASMQRNALNRTSSGRNSKDFSMYATGFGMNYQGINPQAQQYTRVPLQRNNTQEMRMSTLERRRSSQGRNDVKSQGVVTDPTYSQRVTPQGIVSPGFRIRQNSNENLNTGINSRKRESDALRIGSSQNLNSRLSSGSQNSQITVIDRTVCEENEPRDTPSPRVDSQINIFGQQNFGIKPESVDSLKEGDASSVVRFALNKPDLLISQQGHEVNEQ